MATRIALRRYRRSFAANAARPSIAGASRCRRISEVRRWRRQRLMSRAVPAAPVRLLSEVSPNIRSDADVRKSGHQYPSRRLRPCGCYVIRQETSPECTRRPTRPGRSCRRHRSRRGVSRIRRCALGNRRNPHRIGRAVTPAASRWVSTARLSTPRRRCWMVRRAWSERARTGRRRQRNRHWRKPCDLTVGAARTAIAPDAAVLDR